MQHTFSDYQESLIKTLSGIPERAIQRFAEDLLDCYLRKGTVFIVGNGGSAATASHFACDLMKGTRSSDLPTFRVICPTDSIPGLTAWSNDVSYSRALAEHIAAFVSKRDLLIAISASGNSLNVLEAIRVARRQGAMTLAMTGRTGGKLTNVVDYALHAPADLIEQVEDLHLIVAHCLCVMLREELRNKETGDEHLLTAGARPGSNGRVPQAVSHGDAG